MSGLKVLFMASLRLSQTKTFLGSVSVKQDYWSACCVMIAFRKEKLFRIDAGPVDDRKENRTRQNVHGLGLVWVLD